MLAKENCVHLVVVTPYGKFFEGNVEFVSVQLSDGEAGFLVGTAPIVAAIKPGSLRFSINNEWSYAFASTGYVQTGHNYVIVICNAAEWADEIDIARAEEHIIKNQKRLSEKGQGEFLEKIYLASIHRNQARQKVALQFKALQEKQKEKMPAFSPQAKLAQNLSQKFKSEYKIEK